MNLAILATNWDLYQVEGGSTVPGCCVCIGKKKNQLAEPSFYPGHVLPPNVVFTYDGS